MIRPIAWLRARVGDGSLTITDVLDSLEVGGEIYARSPGLTPVPAEQSLTTGWAALAGWTDVADDMNGVTAVANGIRVDGDAAGLFELSTSVSLSLGSGEVSSRVVQIGLGINGSPTHYARATLAPDEIANIAISGRVQAAASDVLRVGIRAEASCSVQVYDATFSVDRIG